MREVSEANITGSIVKAAVSNAYPVQPPMCGVDAGSTPVCLTGF